jgi:purine-binding chemotaxis protein CheW
MSSATQSLARFIAENAPSATAIEPKVERVALLLFEIERSLYAAPLDHVREVVRAEGITRIPQAPEHVRGVQSLRGVVLPVLEIRSRLGLEPVAVTKASRVVVGELGRRWVGLLVDRVQQVAHVPRTALLPPPSEVRSPLAGYLAGTVHVGAQVALLLDLDALLVLPGAEAPQV